MAVNVEDDDVPLILTLDESRGHVSAPEEPPSESKTTSLLYSLL